MSNPGDATILTPDPTKMIALPKRRTYNPLTGFVTTQIFEGLPALMDEQADALVLANSKQRLDMDYAAPGRITAISSEAGGVSPALYDGEANAVWQLFPAVLEKPLASHGQWNKTQTACVILEMIEADLRLGVARETDYNSIYAEGGTAGLQFNLYRDKRLRGQTSYFTHTYNLRQTWSTETNRDLSTDQADNVLTWADINPPLSAGFTQPKIIWFADWTVGAAAGQWGFLLVNEWLVRPVALQFNVKTMKHEITREYWGAAYWDSDTYYHGVL